MGKTQKRIERRKAEKAGRAAIVAQNATEAALRHARQAQRGFTPAQFGYDPELDSNHDYEAFGEPKFATPDTDCFPTGFRGQLGYDGVGLVGKPGYTTPHGKIVAPVTAKQQASALREQQFKQQLRRQRPEYKAQIDRWTNERMK